MQSFLFFLLVALPGFCKAQVEIFGLSFWDSPKLEIYELDNHLSKEKNFLATVEPDSMGIFKTLIELNEISTLQICDEQRCGFIYAQPKTRYLIELPYDNNLENYNETQREIELFFYKLDSNDINYQILGFEAWMDNYLADIYPLKDIKSNEFIIKIMEFKNEAARVYENIENPFLLNYIKYSIGLTIDNFSIVGGPSKEDKYDFYLQNDTIDYSQPKLIEYAQQFYQAYEAQVNQLIGQEINYAFAASNASQLISALMKDPYIYNQNWAEFVALELILAYDQQNRIEKQQSIKMLEDLSFYGQQPGLRKAAAYFLKSKNKLSNGQYLQRGHLEKDLGLLLNQDELLYLHHYVPGNQKCINEMEALKRFVARYNGKVQVISFFSDEIQWTNADNKAFEAVTWQRTILPKTDTLWELLDWGAAPGYVLTDENLKILELNALGPLPNARTQTIDLTIQQYLSNH